MNSTSPARRFHYAELLSFVQLLFKTAGADDELAEIVSTTLIEGDLLGHSTHGVNLVGGYLSSILDGHAKVDTRLFKTLSSSGVSALYDGNYVLGPYCVTKALAFATKAAVEQGIGIAVVRRSHHLGPRRHRPDVHP
jgi:LDH2 family malate/lactate/ureidoglycolate dehydrogenase